MTTTLGTVLDPHDVASSPIGATVFFAMVAPHTVGAGPDVVLTFEDGSFVYPSRIGAAHQSYMGNPYDICNTATGGRDAVLYMANAPSAVAAGLGGEAVYVAGVTDIPAVVETTITSDYKTYNTFYETGGWNQIYQDLIIESAIPPLCTVLNEDTTALVRMFYSDFIKWSDPTKIPKVAAIVSLDSSGNLKVGTGSLPPYSTDPPPLPPQLANTCYEYSFSVYKQLPDFLSYAEVAGPFTFTHCDGPTLTEETTTVRLWCPLTAGGPAAKPKAADMGVKVWHDPGDGKGLRWVMHPAKVYVPDTGNGQPGWARYGVNSQSDTGKWNRNG